MINDMFTLNSRKASHPEEEGGTTRISPIAALGSNTGTSAEAITMELPALGVEFKGREQFLDEIITTLDEMQKVCCCYVHNMHYYV